jgi:hypothetical protein
MFRAACFVNKLVDTVRVTQVGKLNIYRSAEPEELAGLHPADRLMVKLIQIDRLVPRINGMLYRISFDEQWALLDEVRQFSTVT